MECALQKKKKREREIKRGRRKRATIWREIMPKKNTIFNTEHFKNDKPVPDSLANELTNRHK